MLRLARFLLLATIAVSVQPTMASASSDVPWAAPATTQIIKENRQFASGEARLSGTLYLPRRNKPVAVIVVTHSASSPLRDASLYDHLKQMMPALGIAVFVYDRRGSGQSGDATAGGNFTLLADDAIAAVNSLKADPRIDPTRIGTWGLSQGGWISSLAASRSNDIALVVSVSAPVVTADVQMLFSSTNHLRANGHSQAEIDQMVATRKAVDNYMRGTGSKEVAQRLIDRAKTTAWFKYTYMGETVRDREVSGWRREIENDPLTNLSSVAQPTLILYGTHDAVVPVVESVDRLKGIASKMPRMTVYVVAGADHAMQVSVDETVSLDPKNDGTEQADAPEYIAYLASWLTAQGFVTN